MIVHIGRSKPTPMKKKKKKPREVSGTITLIILVVGAGSLALAMEYVGVPVAGFLSAAEGNRGYAAVDSRFSKPTTDQRTTTTTTSAAADEKKKKRRKERREQRQRNHREGSEARGAPPPPEKRPEEQSLQQQQQQQRMTQQPTQHPTQQPTRPSSGKRKFFAVHIGPSKTGTSSIQKSLGTLAFESETMAEDKDKVIYVGKRSLAEWKDPHLLETIRTVDGKSISPVKESLAFFKAKNCMLEILNEHYESHTADTDIETIEDRLENDEATRTSLKTRFTDECWIMETKNNQKHDFRYMLDWSIVDSNEGYSYRQSDYVERGRIFRLFDILGYDTLRLVAAYRRYAEWQVSCHTQKTKAHCLREKADVGRLLGVPCQRFDEYIHYTLNAPWMYNGRMYNNIHETLPDIAAAGPSKLEVKILNFFRQPQDAESTADLTSNHHYDSITTELYCDALGEELTPHTCNLSREIWKTKIGSSKLEATATTTESNNSNSTTTTASAAALVSKPINKGSTSDEIYHSIVAAGYRLGYLLPNDEYLSQTAKRKRQCKRQERRSREGGKDEKGYTWCDTVGECVLDGHCDKLRSAWAAERDDLTANGAVTIVGIKDHPVSSYRELSRYHTEVHETSWMEGLPVQCPTKPTLEKLLDRSLAFEEEVMPDFAATPSGRPEHERLFREVWLEEKKIFCWVDIDRLFVNATSWDEIIDERMVRTDWGEVSYEPYNDGEEKQRVPSTVSLKFLSEPGKKTKEKKRTPRNS